MRVKCVENLGKGLSRVFKRRMFISNNLETDNYEFFVEKGRVYPVLMIFTEGENTFYLIDTKSGRVNAEEEWVEFLPADLFKVVDSRPSNLWSFSYIKSNRENPAFVIWGYPEASNNLAHLFGLMERKREDLKILNKYKEKIETEFST